MSSYPFTSIRCNGRHVLIDDIKSGVALPTHDFERSLFTFIRDWLSDTNSFQLTTSGSTGSPKPITISRDQMTASAQLTIQALELKEGQSALVCLSPDFIAGKMMLVRAFLARMAIIAANPTSHPLDAFNETVDFAAMVPLQVHDMLRAAADPFNKVRTVIVGGGSLDAQDIGMLKHRSCRFFATYGMTETVSHVALRQLNGPGATDFYLAMPGVSFSKDDRGCLKIHWPVLGNVVVTNDLVELIDDVRFLWLGRFDNIINSGGKKIIPEKLEASIAAAIHNAGFSERFFIYGLPDPRLGNKVVMVIEGNVIEQKYNNLRTILQSSLQTHEVPKEYHMCEHFIETQTGKVNRNASLGLAILRNHSSD